MTRLRVTMTVVSEYDAEAADYDDGDTPAQMVEVIDHHTDKEE